MADLAAFISQYLSKGLVGTNPANTGQCTGLAMLWAKAHSKPLIFANAKDLLDQADLTAYTMYRNGPYNSPPPGALVVWGATWGAGYGHVAIVVAANDMHLAVFEQNDPTGSGPLVATHDYSGVIGWLVFK